MDATRQSEPAPTKHRTTVERKSDRELVVTRIFDAPPRIVFEAWTTLELFKRWWVPKSAGLTVLSFEADIRTGGTYRLVFAHSGSEMAFFGKYLEVTPHSRIVWTNEEGGVDRGSITTVTFEERAGKTHQVLHELHSSKESLDECCASGAAEGTMESLDQLEDLVAASAGS